MINEIHIDFFKFEEEIFKSHWSDDIEDGDYVILEFKVTNENKHKYYVIQMKGMDLGEFTEYEQAVEAINKRMELSSFYPNVWKRNSDSSLDLMCESLEED